jgi:hypothetical protein
MRRIITHKSSDLDAVTSVWLLKRFLPGWEEAEIAFVNAGEKLAGDYSSSHPEQSEGSQAIETVDGIPVILNYYIHINLNHHQLSLNYLNFLF